MVSVDFTAFFDRQKVQRAMDRKTNRVLAQTGGYARQIVRRSMRPAGKKGKTSQPGEPPRYHTKLLRDNIFFQYDKITKSAVVGARLINGHKPRGKSNRSTIPELLEFGGTVRVKRKTMRYRPRPYIAPATPKAAEKMREKMRTIPLQ